MGKLKASVTQEALGNWQLVRMLSSIEVEEDGDGRNLNCLLIESGRFAILGLIKLEQDCKKSGSRARKRFPEG